MQQSAASHSFPCQTCEIRNKAICSVLTDEELRRLSPIATSVELSRLQTVFYEGDENTYLFNVVSGAIQTSKLLSDGRRQITGFLFPGDFLGLSASGVYTYSAETLGNSTLCRFHRARFIELLDAFPDLEHKLLELASNELAEAQFHMLLLGQLNALERVSATLKRLVDRIGRHEEAGTVIDLPMRREDLAEYAGVTIETVSRSLTRLRKAGVIDLPQTSTVLVLDQDALERASGL